MGRMRYGVAKALEAEADAILAESIKGVKSHAAKSDILTPWKEQQRRRREVYVGTGVPDPSVRQGMYHRRSNTAHPHLNSRDGFVQSRRGESTPRRQESSLSTFVMSHFLEGGQ